METKMPYVTKQEIEEQNAELLALNEKLLEANKQLINQVPERIGELIETSESFSEFKGQIQSEIADFNSKVSDAETFWEEHLETIQEREEQHIALLDQKYEEIRQTIRTSDDKIQEAKKTIEDSKAESIEAVQAKSVSSQNEVTKATERQHRKNRYFNRGV